MAVGAAPQVTVTNGGIKLPGGQTVPVNTNQAATGGLARNQIGQTPWNVNATNNPVGNPNPLLAPAQGPLGYQGLPGLQNGEPFPQWAAQNPGYNASPSAGASGPSRADLLNAYAAFHPSTLPDPNQIGSNAQSEAEIHALYDQMAGNINNAYNAHLGAIGGAYNAGVNGVNQAGTQAHQQLGLYGQQNKQQGAKDTAALAGLYNTVLKGGNQQILNPINQATHAYGLGPAERAQLAGFVGDLGASKAAGLGLAQQFGQIGQQDNSNAQQVASNIQQGGLTDLHNTDLQALAQAAAQRSTALNNADLQQARLQIAANNGSGSANSLANKEAYATFLNQQMTPSKLDTLAKLAKMRQLSPFSVPSNLFTTGASGAPQLNPADQQKALQLASQLNAPGANPQSIYNQYVGTAGYNPILADLIQNRIGQYNNNQSIFG